MMAEEDSSLGLQPRDNLVNLRRHGEVCPALSVVVL